MRAIKVVDAKLFSQVANHAIDLALDATFDTAENARKTARAVRGLIEGELAEARGVYLEV